MKYLVIILALFAISCSSSNDKEMLADLIGQGYYTCLEPEDIAKIAEYTGKEHISISVHNSINGRLCAKYYRVTVDSIGQENCKAFFYNLN